MVAKLLSMRPFVRYTVMLLASLIPCLAFSYIFSYPLYNTSKQLEKEIVKKKKELDRLRMLALDYKKLKKEVNALKEKLRELEVVLPSSPDVPSFMDDVYFLSKKYQVTTKSMVFSTPQKEGDVLSLPVELGLEGPFHSVALFLSELSSRGRIVSVEDFNFSKKGDEVDVKCLLKLYYSGSKP